MENSFTSRPVACKRCGKPDCAWYQSKKGKWVLVDGGLVDPANKAELVFSKFSYHACSKVPA